MTDNEKAAIAAGLWEPGQERFCKATGTTTTLTAPDMHDPANLWRALENLRQRHAYELQVDDGAADLQIFVGGKCICSCINDDPPADLADATIAALVALYDAEHKDD